MLLGRDRSDMYKYCTRISQHGHGDAAAKTKGRRIYWNWISRLDDEATKKLHRPVTVTVSVSGRGGIVAAEQ